MSLTDNIKENLTYADIIRVLDKSFANSILEDTK